MLNIYWILLYINMRTWKVEYKEVGRDKVFTTKHTGELDEQGVIDFFGLEGSDITWYRVTEE